MRAPTAGRRALLALAAVAATVSAADASAQAGPTRVAIGSFTSAQTCNTYILTSGAVGASASHTRVWGVGSRTALAFAAAWRQELVRDCVDNFSQLRASVEAALGASGRVRVVPRGTSGAIVLTGRVSPVGTSSSSRQTGEESEAVEAAEVTVTFSLDDGRGRSLFGNSVVKRVESGARYDGGAIQMSSSRSQSSAYAQLQRDLAFAVSRGVAFHLDPLRVIGQSGGRIRVNYGSPLVPLGAAMILDAGLEGGQIRGNVVAAGQGFADVESEAGHDLSGVRIGSLVTFAEAEDPASNMPRFERVDLPR